MVSSEGKITYHKKNRGYRIVGSSSMRFPSKFKDAETDWQTLTGNQIYSLMTKTKFWKYLKKIQLAKLKAVVLLFSSILGDWFLIRLQLFSFNNQNYNDTFGNILIVLKVSFFYSIFFFASRVILYGNWNKHSKKWEWLIKNGLIQKQK